MTSTTYIAIGVFVLSIVTLLIVRNHYKKNKVFEDTYIGFSFGLFGLLLSTIYFVSLI